MKRASCVFSVLLLILPCIGCGGTDGKLKVSGTVTLKGEPLDDGIIEFSSPEIRTGANITQGKYEVPPENGLKPGTTAFPSRPEMVEHLQNHRMVYQDHREPTSSLRIAFRLSTTLNRLSRSLSKRAKRTSSTTPFRRFHKCLFLIVLSLWRGIWIMRVRRLGFTLVELLVVIAIIGILVGCCCLLCKRLVKQRGGCSVRTI